MRSKEVEEAIERIEDKIYNHTGYGIEHFKKIALYEDDIDAIKEILSYIETLEKLPNKIREKIKIIEGYSNIAKEEIREAVLVADTNSLNYGRKQAHDADLYHLKSIIGESDEK